jgi:hypothetical protein
MLITKKMLLALALIAALVGGGVGSLITSSQRSEAANDQYTQRNSQLASSTTADAAEQVGNPQQFNTAAEQVAYRDGFEEGFNECATVALNSGRSGVEPANSSRATNYSRTTYRAPRRVSNGTRRVYYDYQTQPKGRSFWSKHRDKLTMAIGAGSGAAIGGAAGGKKWAGIGALIGLGGSALYTYKLRKRNPQPQY